MATEAELRDSLLEWHDRAHRYRAALEFYADPKHWESVEIEKITDVLSSWASGPAVDGGARARAALIDGPGVADGAL